MDDLISRDALDKSIRDIYCKDCNSYNGVRCRACWVDDASIAIDSAPAVDAAPVVHARWEVVQVWKDNPQTTLRCSACKDVQPIYDHDYWLYCPFCGAKMDGGA